MGFLPGDAQEKVDPYMKPIYDNIGVIQKKNIGEYNKKEYPIEKWMAEKKMTVEPLAYIRGRSISDTFFIIDEAQNLTPHEIKTIITRAGEGTKFVFTGDISQIDSPYLNEKSSGLSHLIDKFSGESEFVHINLVKGERSALAEKASRLL
jgi:PhoH-like ATPase